MSTSTAETTMDGAWVPTDTFGARLALVRQHMRWNVRQAAEECGLSHANWRKWEHGVNPQKIHDAARRISDRTGCSYTWLLAGEVLLSTEYERPELTVLQGGLTRDRNQLRIPFLELVKYDDEE